MGVALCIWKAWPSGCGLVSLEGGGQVGVALSLESGAKWMWSCVSGGRGQVGVVLCFWRVGPSWCGDCGLVTVNCLLNWHLFEPH